MTRRSLKIIKRTISVTAILGITGTLIGITANSIIKGKRPENQIDSIVTTTAPFQSLNYNMKKEFAKGASYNVVEPLIEFSPGAPSGGGFMDKVLTQDMFYLVTDEVSTTTTDGITTETHKIGENKTPYTVITEGQSDIAILKGRRYKVLNADGKTTTNKNNIGGEIQFHIRNSRWQNGDLVTADDFVNALKYEMDMSNASYYLDDLMGLNINGLDDCYNEQVKGSSFKESQACTKLFSKGGGFWSDTEPELKDHIADSSVAKTKAKLESVLEGDKGRQGNTWFHVKFKDELKEDGTKIKDTEGNAIASSNLFGPGNANFLLYSSRANFLPVNKKFIDSIGGYKNFGQSAETMLSNGPFILADADLDYELVLKKNPNYWDKERVFLNKWRWRVVANPSVSQSLFRTGKISSSSIPIELLKIYITDPEMEPLIKKVPNLGLATFLAFNTHKPENKYVNNAHLRRAISYAINRHKFLSSIGVGSAPAGDLLTSYNEFALSSNMQKMRDLFLDTGFDPSSRTTTGKSITYPMKGYDKDGKVVDIDQAMIFMDSATLKQFSEEKGINEVGAASIGSYNLAIARYEFDQFKKETGQKHVTLKLLQGGSEDQNTVMIKQMLNAAFNKEVEIEIKPFPLSVFTQKIQSLEGWDVSISSNSNDYSSDWVHYSQFLFKNKKTEELSSSERVKSFLVNVSGEMVFYNPFNKNDKSGMMNDVESDPHWVVNATTDSDKTIDQGILNSLFGVDSIGLPNVSLEIWETVKVDIKNGMNQVYNMADKNLKSSGSALATRDGTISPKFTLHWKQLPFASTFGTIAQQMRKYKIFEFLVRRYAPVVPLYDTAMVYFATRMIGISAIGAPASNVNSYKSAYMCNNMPVTRFALMGCNAITQRQSKTQNIH